MQEKLEFFERNKKILPCYDSYSFWRQLQPRSTLMCAYSTESYVSGAGRMPKLGRTYRWMNETNLATTKNQILARIDDHVAHDHYTVHYSNSASGSVPAHTTCSTNNLRISGCDPEAIEPTDISRSVVANFDSNASTLCCGNDIVSAQNINTPILKIFPSSSDLDSQEPNLTSSIHQIKGQGYADALHEDTSSDGVIFFDADSKLETNLSAEEKPRYSVAKPEHAFAGAMAGIVVSLCLHPMDTVKTVVQSCRANQKPLHYIGRTIISERGVTGLYRGISSNIVSSAPISAVYTFTYESVKKNLLPILPKEYHSLAHCMAGGCASIATSFIFTPSERIKQQMQVGSHYRNSWNALIEVVQKGGLPSLYTGWGAVLCRNVPHSAIKFYTYESLKENMLPSVHPNAEANTSMTLVCGGLAGSIASLFTTPFDVAKTRLQTQIPGSVARYNGVFNTLLDIGKHEGLKGLYR
ncbi:Mitochondrial substrate carrier family protein isoform 1 [Dorcoceras hygrometricum]|uniref:Mitochondrial substrate carrier family protein isoform 1 n=1 Tax=Dorcoceras hygrometricum TaxID=472368 RepID=A0A2Z7A3T8_9LAMI|nr:Mitochondrial substrate carrier family protein isoform 1 [Dorcoceras hygrometricum]